MKKVIVALLVLAVAIGSIGYWLSGNIDRLAKDAIADYGSAMTKARIDIVP